VTAKSLPTLCVSISVGAQVFLLPILGALGDYSNLKKRLMALFCYAGVIATCLLFFLQGNLYLAGYTVQRGQNRDFFTTKLNSSGNSLWTSFINGTSPDAEDEAVACEIYPGDYLITAGFTKNSGESGDFTTEKIDAGTGDSVWIRYYNSPVHDNDKAYDMEVDASGNIYVGDFRNNRIRKITESTVVTFAGDGTDGFKDGPGVTAQFTRPQGVAVDALGNVYVADRGNHRIRKITKDGTVTTIAGNGTPGFKNGTGVNAQFYFPSGIAVDASGNIYVTDYLNHCIRKLQ